MLDSKSGGSAPYNNNAFNEASANSMANNTTTSKSQSVTQDTLTELDDDIPF